MGAGKITVDLEARSDKWSDGVEKAEKSVRKFVDRTEGALKSLAGMKGAGAFADQFATSAKAAADFATEIRTGTGYADAMGKVFDKIPIAGAIRQGGLALKELVTGAKAAAIEMEKVIAHQNRLADGYRAIALAEAEVGKRGVEREFARADESANAEQTRIKNEKEAVAKENREIERSVRRSGGIATPAQEREMKRLHQINDELTAASESATHAAEDRKLEIRKDYEFAFAEDRRKGANETEEVIAGMQERSLRRQGRGLESAIQANNEKVKHQISDLRASISPHELEKLANDDDRAAKVNDVENKISALRRNGFDVNAELKSEYARKEQETAKENQEKLAEIEASGNIERLRVQDEQLNGRAEKAGVTTRSHLAEQAQIEEDHRKQVADLEKKFREDHRTTTVNREDPTLKASLAAADEERRQKLGVLGAKGQNEEIKNRQALIEGERKAWESVGDPMEKYAGHLADINEEFDKFHDAALRDREVRKLDRDTFADLKKLNPDHETPINLFGRTQSFAGIKVHNGAEDIARQQFELIKRQNQKTSQWDTYFQGIWQWARNQTLGAVPEISIGGVI